MEKKKKVHKPHEEDVYPAEEQGIMPEESSQDIEQAMERGDLVEDPATEEGREALVEEDAMEPWEAGFLEGASDEGQHAKDALTGEPLMDVEDVVEAEIEGKTFRFVNEENAEKFRAKYAKWKETHER